MRLENNILFNEFFEKMKDHFPEVSYNQMRDVVYGPWRFIKEVMESGSLATIRIKYFGTFTVYPRKAESELKKIEAMRKKGDVSEKEYLKLTTMIKKYLDGK